MSDDSDGAPVVIQDCDFTGPSSQVWSFVGSTIRQGDKCIDVTDGRNADGVKLQHSGGAILNQPNDIIHWLAHLISTNGNQVLVFTSSDGDLSRTLTI
ncbi:hypothetical protein B0H13DRAFT_2050260, partial [Mycena leptocephala]